MMIMKRGVNEDVTLHIVLDDERDSLFHTLSSQCLRSCVKVRVTHTQEAA